MTRPKVPAMYNRYLTTPVRVLALFVVCFAVVWAADYVMKEGDTLAELAQQRYGDAKYWTALRWYNGIGNERTIPIGTPINFPDKATLDQVDQILKSSTSPAERSAAIAQLGGGTNPVPRTNAGLGKPIHYNAISALARPRVPAR